MENNIKSERRFYVLRTLSGKEKKVKEALEREISRSGSSLFAERLFQIIVPTEKVMTQRGSKKVIIERPYMPGYVLIEAILNPELQDELRRYPDVVGFLGNSTPEPLSTADVNKLLRRVDLESEQEGTYDVSFMVGESVKIVDGPFVGFSAVIEEIYEDKKKLKVMVKIFGRKSPLELAYIQVEKE
ncbi:transcription antitermination protein nusG [Porphyromonas circumdentaria]|uniref:Transcription termination/antitermination protein NusG n=2 Tax=Porphyromonas circumdentaria TaxID=29524 RepID=A0A1T4M729_9PORP|nr:transcription termination/antitermination protein NusG [Porphyromonas circumdentaria]MDO4722159.1 transcription termination/antitermination protein NusG [Porphyromonas circumdentaria]SJZ62524.1 transcription antitermination protein nusG [Porphyromonas circumdentaria]